MTTTQERESKGLKGGALGLVGSIVVGIASTAPAYSLAASLGYVVIVQNDSGIVGVKAPLIMVLAFVPMYFIAVAYAELNKAEPDCGTTFTWAARAFGTRTGWLGGWGIIAATRSPRATPPTSSWSAGATARSGAAAGQSRTHGDRTRPLQPAARYGRGRTVHRSARPAQGHRPTAGR